MQPEISRCSGHCCTVFNVGHKSYSRMKKDYEEMIAEESEESINEAIKSARSNGDTIMAELFPMLIPLTKEEAVKRFHGGGSAINPDGLNQQYYTCKNYDESTGNCLIYDHRPLTCIKFPDDEPGGVCLHPNCTRKTQS